MRSVCAVARPCLFDVHDIDERADVLVVVEGLALELVGDGASLVVHAARVVTQIRHRGFRDEDLLCVVVGTHHAAPGVQDVVHPGTLIDLVHYGHVVLCVCDAARYGLALLLDVALVGEPGNLTPVLELLAGVGGRTGVGKPGRAGAVLGALSRRLEELRLGSFSLSMSLS